MTFRYDTDGVVDLVNSSGGQYSTAGKWTGDATLKSGLNQWIRGGLNVYWASKQVEIFMEDNAGAWKSIGKYSFRQTATTQVNRLYLGTGPGGTAAQGVSWDSIYMSSTLLPIIPEPISLLMFALSGCLMLRRRRA